VAGLVAEDVVPVLVRYESLCEQIGALRGSLARRGALLPTSRLRSGSWHADHGRLIGALVEREDVRADLLRALAAGVPL
jgi:hypothetical protein